jgi:hypothetical protein
MTLRKHSTSPTRLHAELQGLRRANCEEHCALLVSATRSAKRLHAELTLLIHATCRRSTGSLFHLTANAVSR